MEGKWVAGKCFFAFVDIFKKVKSSGKDLEYKSQPRWPPGPPQHLQSTSRVSRTAIRGQKRPLACRPHPRLTVLRVPWYNPEKRFDGQSTNYGGIYCRNS